MQLALQYALEREQWSSGLQQKHTHHHTVELERLQQQLAEAKAERDKACQAVNAISAQRDSMQKEVESLQASLAGVNSHLQAMREEPARSTAPVSVSPPLPVARHGTTPMSRATAVAVSVFAGASLFASIAFHDASGVKAKRQGPVTAVNALETVEVAKAEPLAGKGKKPSPQSDKGKTRFVRSKAASQRQWGPAMLMTDADAGKPHVVYDPVVKEQQENLLVLGFDLGEADGFAGLRTRQAIEEFRSLYLSDPVKQPHGADLAVIIRNYANLARSDAARFGIDTGVVAAIRLSSVRTGVDFSYLMKLAATESNFEPLSRSSSSSATGMYQFTHDTWLRSLKRHGGKYGLAGYAAKIEYYVTRSGYQRPMVKDEALYKHLLELRKNPRISAMMAAESVRDNQRKLAFSFDREPEQADLYLTHFLGSDGAITFLKALEQNPDTFAVDIFPEAARSNQGIFHPKTCNPRTVDEVYELFGEKFSTGRYDDLASN